MDTGKVGIKWKRLDEEGEGKIESHDDNAEEKEGYKAIDERM